RGRFELSSWPPMTHPKRQRDAHELKAHPPVLPAHNLGAEAPLLVAAADLQHGARADRQRPGRLHVDADAGEIAGPPAAASTQRRRAVELHHHRDRHPRLLAALELEAIDRAAGDEELLQL